MTSRQFDVIIVGGGLVGASLACALADTQMRVAMIEAVPLRSSSQASYDDRTLALSRTTVEFLKRLGAWSALGQEGSAISRIHVSSKGQFGRVIMNAAESGVDAFGHVIEARLVGAALYERLARAENLTLLCPAKVVSLEVRADAACVTLETDAGQVEVDAKLVVGADGAGSQVRQHLNIEARTHAYEQTAIIANLTPALPHDGTAFERLTRTGPIAVLPQAGGRCGLVWVTTKARAVELLESSDEDFLHGAQRRFGWRLGKFLKVGKRASYSLKLVVPDRDTATRSVLIGNAAHTIHPIAAQGFNLGVRDVAELAELLIESAIRENDLGSAAMLDEYSSRRERDQRRTVRFTDGLVRVFASEFLPVVVARGSALCALQYVPPLRREFARISMGGAQPERQLAVTTP